MHWACLRPLLRFSGGMAGTMLLGHTLNSLDQVILSAILPLAEFGYYTLAVGVAATLGLVGDPVTTAVYPRFSQLVERAPREVSTEYHFFSQLVAVLVLPLGAILIFFPADVLALWTRNPDVVSHAATGAEPPRGRHRAERAHARASRGPARLRLVEPGRLGQRHRGGDHGAGHHRAQPHLGRRRRRARLDRPQPRHAQLRAWR